MPVVRGTPERASLRWERGVVGRAALLAVLASLVPFAGCERSAPPETSTVQLFPESAAVAAQTVPAPQAVDGSRENAIVHSARRVAPAVVSVLTLTTESVRRD